MTDLLKDLLEYDYYDLLETYTGFDLWAKLNAMSIIPNNTVEETFEMVLDFINNIMYTSVVGGTIFMGIAFTLGAVSMFVVMKGIDRIKKQN